MKVKIGALEISDLSWEELDLLIDRYGAGIEEASRDDDDAGQGQEPVRRRNGSATASDRVVLERLTQAGNDGLPTQDLGEILGRRGKSIKPGLMEWAIRIGLVTDRNIDPFEDTRVGTRRAARLKPSFQSVAKELLNRL